MVNYLDVHKLRSKICLGCDSTGEDTAHKFRWVVINVIDRDNDFEKRIVSLVEETFICWHGITIFRRFYEQQMLLLLFSVESSGRL